MPKRTSRRKTYYPDSLTVRMRAGVRDRIQRAAEAEDTDPAEWTRRLIDRGLEAARKRIAARKRETAR